MGWDGADWNQEGETREREWSTMKEEKARGSLREMKEEAAAAVFKIWGRT